MRIINIIESTDQNPVLSIESFGVFEEQLVEDVVEKAEELFVQKAVENGATEEEAYESLENGWWVKEEDDYYNVSIVWSEI